MTVTRMMFGSEQVQVEEEQLAFTGTDLLADFGDILGLFIGFNFIIIVDINVIFVQRFNCKYLKMTYCKNKDLIVALSLCVF